MAHRRWPKPSTRALLFLGLVWGGCTPTRGSSVAPGVVHPTSPPPGTEATPGPRSAVVGPADGTADDGGLDPASTAEDPSAASLDPDLPLPQGGVIVAEAPPPQSLLGDDWGPNKEPMPLEIRNTCRNTVNLYFGEERPNDFVSALSLAGYSSIHMSVLPHGTIWLVDDERVEQDHVELSPEITAIDIAPDCQRFLLR